MFFKAVPVPALVLFKTLLPPALALALAYASAIALAEASLAFLDVAFASF